MGNNGYKFKLVYIIGNPYDVKFGNNRRQLEVFAKRSMKVDSWNIIDL